MISRTGFNTLPAAARTAILVTTIAGVAAAVISARLQGTLNLVQLAFFVLLSIATARAKVKLTGTSTLSLLTATVLLSLVAGGPATAVVTAVCGVITQSVLPAKKKIVLHQVVFNAGMIATAATAAAWTYRTVLDANHQTFSAQFNGMMLAAFVYFLGNSVFVSMIVSFTKGGSISGLWFEHFAPTAPSFLIAGVVSLVVLELLSNYAMMPLAMAAIAPVYYSSIRLAGRSIAVKV